MVTKLQPPSPAGAPTPHKLGGAHHDPDTLANLNTKVSDATLDDESDPRTPLEHGHPQYIKHSLATAISDFLVASGVGVFVKKTLAEVKTLLNWAADITTHSNLTTGVHGVGAGTVMGTTLTQAVTNKRNRPRVSSAASGDISPSVATADIYIRTAQAAALTINNPIGSPAQGEKLMFRLKDNGVARAITFGAQYRALEFALPAITVAGKLLYMGFIFNSTDTKWDMLAIDQE